MPPFFRYAKPAVDLVITLLLWIYFIFGFILFFAPFYLLARVMQKGENTYQGLNHRFIRVFFSLLRFLNPRVCVRIDPRVRDIRSSVIVCNHLSYLDPLLIISLFEKHRTIVKSTFFTMPIFGWVMRAAGYVPSVTGERLTDLMINRVESMPVFLTSGGNLFIFPEGTRSRDGRIGAFNEGAFKIARQCQAPIQVIAIRGTHHLFRPDSFLFNTWTPLIIEIKRVGTIPADECKDRGSVPAIMQKTRTLLETVSFTHEDS